MRKRQSLALLLLGVMLAAPALSYGQGGSDVWVPYAGAPQYFAVLVSDVDASAGWYRTAFGLDEVERSAADDGAWEIVNLRNDRLFVEIIRDDRAKDVGRALGFRKVGFFVRDLDAVVDRVERATGERPRILSFERFGVRIIQLRDPDDNVIQLFEPLSDG